MSEVEAKAPETPAQIMYAELGEEARYETAGADDEIMLPLTKSGFESLLIAAAALYQLPTDDKMRQVLAGYIHHIPNETNLITLRKIGIVLYKSIVNSTTWMIDQECKAIERQKQIQAQQALQEQADLARKAKSAARKTKYKHLKTASTDESVGQQQQ